jgi:hypothetical protein
VAVLDVFWCKSVAAAVEAAVAMKDVYFQLVFDVAVFEDLI